MSIPGNFRYSGNRPAVVVLKWSKDTDINIKLLHGKLNGKVMLVTGGGK